MPERIMSPAEQRWKQESARQFHEAIYQALIERYGDQVSLGVGDRLLLRRFIDTQLAGRYPDQLDTSEYTMADNFVQQYYPDIVIPHESFTSADLTVLEDKYGLVKLVEAVWKIAQQKMHLRLHMIVQYLHTLSGYIYYARHESATQKKIDPSVIREVVLATTDYCRISRREIENVLTQQESVPS